MQNTTFVAGPGGQANVKKTGPGIRIFRAAPETWRLWPICVHEGRLIEKTGQQTACLIQISRENTEGKSLYN